MDCLTPPILSKTYTRFVHFYEKFRLSLSPKEYQMLVEVAHHTHDPRQVHRAQALLWLHEGDTVDEVATRLFTTPRTVFRFFFF